MSRVSPWIQFTNIYTFLESFQLLFNCYATIIRIQICNILKPGTRKYSWENWNNLEWTNLLKVRTGSTWFKPGFSRLGVRFATHCPTAHHGHIIYVGTMRNHVVPCGTMWYHVLPCGTMWYHVLPCVTMCYHVVPCGTMWYHVVPCGTMWYHVVPCGTMWYHVVPCGTMWYHVVPCGTMWYHVVPWVVQWKH